MDKSNLVNISIIDSNQYFTEALQVLLNMTGMVRIVSTSYCAEQFFQNPDFADVDMVFLDLIKPIKESIKIPAAIKNLKPDMSIVAMSNLEHRHIATKALNAGADTYLPKINVSKNILDQTIRELFKGINRSHKN